LLNPRRRNGGGHLRVDSERSKTKSMVKRTRQALEIHRETVVIYAGRPIYMTSLLFGDLPHLDF
jgi:hypothetical protein